MMEKGKNLYILSTSFELCKIYCQITFILKFVSYHHKYSKVEISENILKKHLQVKMLIRPF